MTEFTNNLLATLGEETRTLFTHKLNVFMKVGIEPKFTAQELKELWFYIKVHELADSLQRVGTNKTLHTKLLIESLDWDGAKLYTPNYKIGSKKRRDEKCESPNLDC